MRRTLITVGLSLVNLGLLAGMSLPAFARARGKHVPVSADDVMRSAYGEVVARSVPVVLIGGLAVIAAGFLFERAAPPRDTSPNRLAGD